MAAPHRDRPPARRRGHPVVEHREVQELQGEGIGDGAVADPLALQLLYFPMLDDRMTTPSSGWTVPVWGRHANAWAWRAYLGDDPDLVAAQAASGRAPAAELRGLPPA